MDNHELPPGMRFYPTEEELFSFYLHHRLANSLPDIDQVIPVVDVYHFDPSQLPERSGIHNVSDPEQWFFFCPRQEREALGGRPTRTTPSGYWKATGSSSLVYSTATRQVLGMKKTMVFYTGRAPNGTKTMWKMNEYKAVDVQDNAAADATASSVAPMPGTHPRFRSEFSLCRVYIKTGTLRAFDRRPIVSHDQNEASTFNANQPPPPAETALTDSIGSASSGDDAIDWSNFEEDLVNFPSLN